MSREAMDLEPRLCTVDRAADLLGIGTTKAWELVASGQLPSIKIGKARRVIVAGIDEYIARNAQEAS